MRKALLLAGLGLGVLAQSLGGQSPFGVQGLGLPLEPLDARARALGGMGVGLIGASLLPTDPAAAAVILVPTLHVTAQPFWGNAKLGGESFKGQGTRFPLLGFAFPVVRLGGTVTLTLGGFMDQRWEVEREGTAELGGTVVPTTELFTSNGGVSTVRLGWAQRVREWVAVGVGVGGRTGSVTRTFTRTLDAEGLATQVTPYVESVQWQYSGLSASVGVIVSPLEIIRVSGTATWSGDLEAKPSALSEKEGASYALPAEYRLGASAVLTPRLAMNFGLSHANWEASEDGLEPETVTGSIWGFGAGAEWLGPTVGSRNFPIRLGFRRADLPFRFDGKAPKETAFSGGLTINLTPANATLVGAVDIALERGNREAGSLSESFWRGTATFRVATW
jgi:hypothetical protein